LADAIKGPRVGFELAIDAERGSGWAGRDIALVDCEGLGAD
jgi:hypothetical protein